ncbi:MAG TPA: GNAT family protein [Gemmatimonadaceae bacterium]|nr:GNAT family protein [Gemmatimonadaceae bacterium]
MKVTPVTLSGRLVRLVPLTSEHVAPLYAVASDPELWRWTVSRIASVDDMRAYVEAALEAQRAGTALPFVTTDAATGEVIGSTRFGNIDLDNRRAEIGWTWLRRDRQRTGCNTEAKLLMLRHAFDVLGCIRVELKTDALNQQSRAAILGIGAVEEGILRSHMVTASGRLRDSVYYSILDREWPAVRARLEERMTRGARGARRARGAQGGEPRAP